MTDTFQNMDRANTGFIHSVKIPDIYRKATKILKLYCNKQGSLQNLVYGGKFKIFHKRLYALVSRVIANYSLLENALTAIHLFEEQPRFDRFLAIILASELISNEGPIQGECKPVCVINSYESKLRHWLEENQDDLNKTTAQTKLRTSLPKYVRINTILKSAKKVHKKLDKLGWKRMKIDNEKTSYDDFLQMVEVLKEPFYMDDYHLPNLLLFPPNQEFWNTDLYKKNYIVLQDKASCLPPFVSGVCPGDIVLDACAAPGNKTSYLASMMNNEGKIVAVDMNTKRFSTLKNLLESRGIMCTEFCNRDFTSLDPSDYADVKIILVDPTCSSSGTSVHEDELSKERITSLSRFQFQLLRHALSFPFVETVVYSTCSVNEEENEGVISRALSEFENTFELEELSSLLPQWKHFGMTSYSFGHLCLRTKSQVDKCHGFFVAKFKRKTSQELPNPLNTDKQKKRKKLSDEGDSEQKKKKKKREK